jgi:hypothetical protein
MFFTQRLARLSTNYNNQKSMVFKLRAKRIAPLLEMIEEVFKENGIVNVVDIGGTESYWGIIADPFFDKFNINITIVNLPGIQKSRDLERFRFIEADGCDLSYIEDESFHIAHSNSVIEHVGDWKRMTSFAMELSRVAPKYFVQTPNYWFPMEPHCMMPFFHWLPKPIRLWLVLHFQMGHWKKAETIDEAMLTVESVHLLTKKMFRELFKDAQILTERAFWFPKSLVALKNE